MLLEWRRLWRPDCAPEARAIAILAHWEDHEFPFSLYLTLPITLRVLTPDRCIAGNPVVREAQVADIFLDDSCSRPKFMSDTRQRRGLGIKYSKNVRISCSRTEGNQGK